MIAKQELGKIRTHIDSVKDASLDTVKGLGYDSVDDAVSAILKLYALKHKVEVDALLAELTTLRKPKNEGLREKYSTEREVVKGKFAEVLAFNNALKMLPLNCDNKTLRKVFKDFKQSLVELGEVTKDGAPSPRSGHLPWFLPCWMQLDSNPNLLLSPCECGWDDGTGRVMQYSVRAIPVTKSQKGRHTDYSMSIPAVSDDAPSEENSSESSE